jgi:hypothetical protein
MSAEKPSQVRLNNPMRDAGRGHRADLAIDKFMFRAGSITGPSEKFGDSHARGSEFG